MKKFLSLAVVMSVLVQHASFLALAAGSLNVDYVAIGWSTASSVSFNPGATFGIDGYGDNTTWWAIKELYFVGNFGNNSGFTYAGSAESTFIDPPGSTVNNPVPAGAYTSWGWLMAEITGPSQTQAAAGAYFGMEKSNNTPFTVSSTMSTYSNVATFWFQGKNVSDSSVVTGWSISKTIYVNVKPHVIEYAFKKADDSTTTSQIQGDLAESINLVLRVKDYNGCTNIDGGTVTADLTQLGFSSNESLLYMSCEADGKTAVFKKTGITTLASAGDKTFTSSHFVATDENGNVNSPTDANTTFDDEDQKTNLVLTVIPPAAPTVSILSTSETFIGWPSKPSTLITFSGSQGREIKVAVGSDGSCTGGTTVVDWTGSGSYTASTSTGVTVAATSLVDGANLVYACVRNSGGNIGSANVAITKDTTAPTISNNILSPANVVTNDPTVSFKCSENGIYQVEVGGNGTFGNGTFVGSGSATANTTNSQTIANALLALGANTIRYFCRDAASNVGSGSGTVTKTPPTPSMAGQTVSFSDNDVDHDGLDGRDLLFTWNNANAVAFGTFESYRLYLLPTSTTFDSATQTRVALLTDKNLSSWTGSSTLTTDSLNSPLVSGASYKMCIVIMGSSGLLGTEWCTAGATLTADTVSHPSVVSAKFTSDTNLEITTDATLDTTLSNHSGALISFVKGGSTLYPTSVASVSGTKINLTIPSLGSISATGSTLIIQTGALRANGGGFNNLFSSGGLVIKDGQAPTVTAFSKTTAPIYGTYHMGNVAFSYTFGEAMNGGGNTRFEFSRTSGNSDGTTRSFNITAPGDLTAGSHSITIDLNALGLISGTTYRVLITGKDLAGNTVDSSYITSIWFDNIGPAAPTLTNATFFSTLTPTLSWAAPLDDSGNGSGIAKYILKVYNGAACATGSLAQTYDPVTSGSTSKSLNALPTNPGSYSWNLVAIDNMGNTGSLATCDDFSVDTNLPTISGQTINDDTLTSTTYTKTGDTVRITATIANTDANHIWLDMSSLAGSATYNNVLCGNTGTPSITCTYSSGVATYSFNVGFAGTVSSGARQVQFHSQNTAGLNDQTAIASTTADNAAPSVSANSLTSPNGGEVWGGNSRTITWTAGSVTDNIGVTTLRLEYSTGAGIWNLINNGTNAGSYVWDITGLESRNDYTIRLTAIDPVGNTASDTSNAVFTIDRTAPVVASNALTSPNGGTAYKWGQTLAITWNAGSVTDAGGLAASPITLEYSLDNGTNWTQIATGLGNSGTYNWTIPSANASACRVRLTAIDTAGNTASDMSDTSFVIDSTVPSVSISYAGGGGNTPQNGRKINNTGIDVTLGSTDAYLDQVYYQLINTTDGVYWNNSTTSWLGVATWNVLCSDGAALGTDLACSTISSTINPSILDGKNYTLAFRSIDEAGNTTTSIVHAYTGDTVAPSLAISTASGSYLGNGITIAGTSSDAGSSVSSVKIQIQKGAQYWDGSGWTATNTSLLTQTSNSYANWTYAFNPPLADPDGQSYIVTVTAYDSAYKVNNSTSSSITLTKDTSGPAITSDVFTFNTSLLYRGNASFNVTWDTSKVTSTGAGLAASPITLAYNFTGTVVTIASNIANSGTYSFSLPVVDTSTAKIIISATDSIGNTSSTVASANFSIDSLPPQIQSVSTMDQDANGQIDSLFVTMNEAIKDSSVTLANFSIGSGIGTPTGFQTGLSADDTTFVLTFANSGNSGTVPTLSYTAGTLVDLADNSLATVSNISSSDNVPPRVVSTEIHDLNADGKFDQIKVRFTETMAVTTSIADFTVNNAIAWLSIASAARDGTNTDTFNLALNASTDPNTDKGSMTLSFNNTSVYKDLANKTAIDFTNQTIVDKAKPVIVSAVTKDANNNGKVDRVDIRFSEAISGNVDGDFSIGSLSAGASKGTSSITSDTLEISINETSDAHDTNLAPTFTYSGTNLTDSAGNLVAAIASHAVSDKVAPRLLTRATRDADGNGKIDAIKLTFSENLNSSTGGLNVSVAGYTVTGYDSLCGGSTANDAILCATLTEKTIADTDATPAIQVITNTTLGDTSGNIFQTEGSATNAADAAGPVIVGARYDTAGAGVADDTISIAFSENIDSGTLAATSSTDFILTSGGAFAGNSTSVFGGGATATITMGAGATALTPGTSKISITTGGIADSLGNVSPTEGAVNRVVVTSTVIISEVMWSNTGSSAHQYIELKNIGSSPVNVNGWTIDNAGWNGVNLTLPNDTIAGGGIYLIAKNAESSSVLNVTPNLVSNTVNLSASQNNLVLRSGAVTYDTAKANPWPAWDTNAPASMERRNPAGDGTVGTNWYVAQASVGFDGGSTAKGTPGSENVFDATSPTISSYSPENNSLLPTSPSTIAFAFSDVGDSGINTASDTFQLQKWNSSAYTDVTALYVNTGAKTVNAAEARYPLSSVAPYGKYRATFSISDLAGNIANQTVDFYVDQPSITISTNSSDIGAITANTLNIGSTEITVTVKTVGAGFNLAHDKIGTMTASGGAATISDWSGANGFGFDYSESGSGNTVAYAGTLTAVNGNTLGTYAASPDPNGNLKTYTYKIKYGANVTTVQTAGIYSGSNAYRIQWTY